MTALVASVLGVSVWGPGLEGWERSRPVLTGTEPYSCQETAPPVPTALPAAERRRCGPVVRLAMAVAGDAAAHSGLDPGGLRSVFASSNGDGPVVGSILGTLAAAGPEERPVSPTQFHNSVHNAPAGYWSIAHGNAQSAVCLGLHDDTVAAALMTALAEVVANGVPVLVAVYDYPMPPPLAHKRPTPAPFGFGLVLAPVHAGRGTATLSLRHDPDLPCAPPLLRTEGLRALAAGNAAARGLCLLEALARGGVESHRLPYLDGSLALDIAMPDHAPMAALLPHAGSMILLDAVESWDATAITCSTVSHLRADNPLRRDGCLPAIAAVEYGLQAAAAHGALTASDTRPAPGLLAGLRAVSLRAKRLDDPGLGRLRVTATLEHAEAQGAVYGFIIAAEDGRPLVTGRGTIARVGPP
jgi:predicted hotdog family 3-hydroxylacyl-ACP dehydratase